MKIESRDSFIVPAAIAIGTSALLGRFFVKHFPATSYRGLFIPSLYGSFLNILTNRCRGKYERFSFRLVRMSFSFFGGALLAISLKGRAQIRAKDALSISGASILLNSIYQVMQRKLERGRIAREELEEAQRILNDRRALGQWLPDRTIAERKEALSKSISESLRKMTPLESQKPELGQLKEPPLAEQRCLVESLINIPDLLFKVIEYSSTRVIVRLGFSCKQIRNAMIGCFNHESGGTHYVLNEEVPEWLDKNRFRTIVFYNAYLRNKGSFFLIQNDFDFVEIVFNLERKWFTHPFWRDYFKNICDQLASRSPTLPLWAKCLESNEYQSELEGAQKLLPDLKILQFRVIKFLTYFCIENPDLLEDAPALLKNSIPAALLYFNTSSRIQHRCPAPSRCSEDLKYFSLSVRDNKEVVLEALNVNRDNADAALGYRYASDRLKNDKSFFEEACRLNGAVLAYAQQEWLEDLDLVFEVFKTSPRAFRSYVARMHLDVTQQENRNFILKALKINGLILEELGGLKDDKFIVITAILQNPEAFRFASSRLKNDIDIARLVARRSLSPLESRLEFFSQDEEIKRIIVSRAEEDPVAYRYSSEEVKKDRIIALKHLRNGSFLLEDVPIELRDDHEIVMAALETSYFSYNYASRRLMCDPSIIKKTLECAHTQHLGIFHRNYTNHVILNIFEVNKSREVALQLLKTFYNRYEDVDKSLTEDQNFLVEACRANGLVLECLPRKKKKNELVMAALKENPASYPSAPETFKRMIKDC